MEPISRENLPFVRGAGAGVIAWVVGYLLTYLVVGPSLSDSSVNRLLEAVEGSLPTADVVGWTFFNAHFVDTAITGLPLMEDSATTFVGGDNGFTIILYLVPVGLLLAAGLALARYHGAASPRQGAIVGLTAVPGYLLLSVVGAFFFQVTGFGATVAPNLVTAVIVAGIVYPVLFAAAGGALGGVLEDRERDGALDSSW